MGFERFVVFLSLLILVFMFLVELFLIKNMYLLFLVYKYKFVVCHQVNLNSPLR